ncbi:MAG: reductive dehalogenase domain-containing protein, partial [Anaerolineae bacterium]|nr:reductive dehalogenase domain-containing protein [Anaerolineae bacterium]
MDKPTYTADIVGDITRIDERDIVFSRSELIHEYGESSPECESYYNRHPEWREVDLKTNAMSGLGHTAGRDAGMFTAPLDAIESLRFTSSIEPEIVPSPVSIDPGRAAYKIKQYATFLGADLVNVGPLRQQWVYSHEGRVRSGRRGEPIDLSHHPNAIAMGFRMDYHLLRSAPDLPAMVATAKGYALGAWVSLQMVNYIRSMGYSAKAHYDANYQVQCVPVAVDCGMGELSRAGFLLTKILGLGLRLAVITTNMPLIHDKPVDIGVQSFCETCRICAEVCPIGAIPKGSKIPVNGVKRWKLDMEDDPRWHH